MLGELKGESCKRHWETFFFDLHFSIYFLCLVFYFLKTHDLL